MQSIFSSIKDPAWWFTVFFIGIIVSVAAGFLKDWIAGAFAKYSRTLREHRRAKAQRREALFEALAANEAFLILSMVRLMGLVVLSFLIMGVYFCLPVMAELKEILCSVAPGADKCSRALQPFAEKVLILVTGGLAMLTSYKASSRFGLVMEGLRRYRKQRGLPRVV